MKKISFILSLLALTACGNDLMNDSQDSSDNSVNINNITNTSDDIDSCEVDFLWKPISESDGNLVILFENGAFFQEVAVERNDGELEAGTDVGFTNGGRQTWRFTSPGEEYTGNVFADDCTFEVEDPSERAE